MEEKLFEYAKLVMEVGLNVQKGQTVIISSPVECAHFARLCADAAYNCGCREVVMNWSDDHLTRQKYLRADSAVFDEVLAWREEYFTHYAELGAAYLAGLAVGYWQSAEDITRNWSVDRVFRPAISEEERTRCIKGWNKAVRCAYHWARDEEE